MKISIPQYSTPRNMLLAAVAMFALSFGYNIIRHDLTDDAVFGGDTWFYQSIAVNLALGDGYRLGALHDFSVYKFARDPDSSRDEGYHERLKEVFLKTDRADFYGSPGLPLFLAGIYRTVGVSPVVAKYTNVVLVALAATLILVISARIWPLYGLATGTIAGLVFIFFHAPEPGLLMGEPLIMFLLALWGALFTYFGRNFTVIRVLALAVLTAGLILVKSYALLIFLTAALIALKHRSRRQGLALAALYMVTVALLILPWSIYATRHSDRVVVISTQFDNLIMDGNNEDAISGGGWSPWWRKEHKGDPKYLYNRLADSDMGAIRKVGLFYRENWMHLPQLFANKIYSATGRKVHVILILLTFVAYHVVGLRRNRRLRRAGQPGDVIMPDFPLLMFAVWLTNALVGFGLLRYTLIFLPFMLITVAYAPLEFRRIRRETRR